MTVLFFFVITLASIQRHQIVVGSLLNNDCSLYLLYLPIRTRTDVRNLELHETFSFLAVNNRDTL